MIKYYTFVAVCFLFGTDHILAQIKPEVAEREQRYADEKKDSKYYVDVPPDTLLMDGKVYFFRQTPVHIKEGYTDVFHPNEVHISEYGGYLYFGRSPKGYTLTWIIQNGSLFIKKVYPAYLGSYIEKNKNKNLKKKQKDLENTTKSRIERFVGKKFKKKLLHVDWISGDFGIIDSYRTLTMENRLFDENGHYLDGREKGFIITFKKGKFIEMKIDEREIKN
jgi:hypothetical protein